MSPAGAAAIKKGNRKANTDTDRHTDTETDTDRHRDRQTDTHTHTDRHTHTHKHTQGKKKARSDCTMLQSGTGMEKKSRHRHLTTDCAYPKLCPFNQEARTSGTAKGNKPGDR